MAKYHTCRQLPKLNFNYCCCILTMRKISLSGFGVRFFMITCQIMLNLNKYPYIAVDSWFDCYLSTKFCTFSNVPKYYCFKYINGPSLQNYSRFLLITLLKFILLNAPHYKINKNTKRNSCFKLISKLILSQYPDIAFNC